MSDTSFFAAVLWAPFGIPSGVFWPYFAGACVLLIGLCTTFLGNDWPKAKGLDKFILFGTLFYAVPIAVFGPEHYTATMGIAGLIPKWIPWHVFWTYLVGTSLIAAGLSLVTKIQARLAAALLGLMFFLFVVLMHIPNWAQNPRDRIALAITCRDLSFSGGALALAGSLTAGWWERGTHILATIGRYFMAIPVLVFAVEQFLHPDYVPAVPLERPTPTWIPGHIFWCYLCAAVYVVVGIALLLGIRARWAATWLGVMVFVVVLFVYVPIWLATPGSIDDGLNYIADTLMLSGAALFLAGAIPKGQPVHANEMAAGD